MMNISNLIENIGFSDIKFSEEELFVLAMTHSSYAQDKDLGKLANNERLEFYGDAVLKLACSKFLYEKFPYEREGVLSEYRCVLVSDNFLTKYADDINLGDFLLVGNRPDLKNKKVIESLKACAFEALLGAIFIQTSFDIVYDRFLKQFFIKYIVYVKENLQKINSKATLQEFTQAQNKQLPKYELVEKLGKDHEQVFVISVKYNGKEIGRGSGSTKKEAEQAAAYEACVKLGAINE